MAPHYAYQEVAPYCITCLGFLSDEINKLVEDILNQHFWSKIIILLLVLFIGLSVAFIYAKIKENAINLAGVDFEKLRIAIFLIFIALFIIVVYTLKMLLINYEVNPYLLDQALSLGGYLN